MVHAIFSFVSFWPGAVMTEISDIVINENDLIDGYSASDIFHSSEGMVISFILFLSSYFA